MVETVAIRSPAGRIEYRDTRDHFENGLLRLMQLDRAEFERWLALADAEAAPDILPALARAFAELRPMPPPPPSSARSVEAGPEGEPGALLHPAIGEAPGRGVACAADGSVGWLVRPEPDRWARETIAPPYEEAYFEGQQVDGGGYRNYESQSVWRLEKARRQVGDLRASTGIGPGGRALDVGSGYGFFRRALEEAGIAHEGLEISSHARSVAHRLFGFDSAVGSLADHRDAWHERFDLLTLWDTLEHVPSPRAYLADAAACLRPGGALVIKTPNLDCPEAELFGPRYHSLRREHLIYFTASGLGAAAQAAGLESVHVSSISHLLVGFVGRATTERWARDLRGADLMVVLRKMSTGRSSLRSTTERL